MRRDRLLLAALLVVTTLAALPVLTYPLGRDQGEFATIGRGILDGRVPYVDLWNPKPPAVFYVSALAIALLGRTTAALRAIDLVIAPLISLALYWLGKRLASPRVGLWAALIFPVFYFTETFWTLTQNDGIAMLPMTLAVMCIFKTADSITATDHPAPTTQTPSEEAISSPHVSRFLPLSVHGERVGGRGSAALWAFAAGALIALTVWFKYPFALFALVLIPGYIRSGRVIKVSGGTDAQGRPYFADRWFAPPFRLVLAALLGGLLVGPGGVAYMAAIGALPALIESTQVTSQYTALTFNAEDFGQLMRTALDFRWQQWGLLWALAALWFVTGRIGEARQRGWGIILLWLLAGLVILLVQAKGYDYHWLPMLPPLALLAADSVDRVTRMLADIVTRLKFPPPLHVWRGDRGVRYIIPALAAFAFLCIMIFSIWPRAWPYLTGHESQVEYYGKFQAGEFVADESLQVASFLRERVAPGDSLFIWGFRPEVYYLSQLNPAVRFIFQFPLVADWYPASWREETVDILWAALPPYVLVLQVDYMPWVTGSNDDSNTLLQQYTELNDWLIFNYERETQIGNFFIWRRKTL